MGWQGKKRFMGSVDSSDALHEASRLGHRRIVTHTRGWDVGVSVTAYIGLDGKDRIGIWTTGGSNNPHQKDFIAEVHHDGTVHHPEVIVEQR